MKTYKLKISPFFKEDLEDATEYIAKKLKNPQAAKRLIVKTNKAIRERLFMPLAAEPYRPENSNRVYYRIYVDNFTVYYVVQDNTMKVMRLIYGARDIGRIL